MKKFLFSILIVFLMVCLLPFSVQAEENNESSPEGDKDEIIPEEIVKDSTIIKFDYYPGGTLSKERELTFEWISTEKMENLVIRLFNPNTSVYVDIFDASWDLTDEELKFTGKFEIVNEPLDDPLTPDVDETKDKLWEYKLTFKLAKDTYGLLKFMFVYECSETLYENLFYLPNVVYPSVVVPPTPPTTDDSNKGDNSSNDDDNVNDGYFTTSNALIAAIFATICSVIGTLLIIFSSQYRKFDDEELK